jgi:Lipid A 3-O-deacylase (PagL)
MPKLFNLNWKVVIPVVILIILLLLGMIWPKAHAAEAPLDAPYVQFGVGAAVVRGETEAIDLTFTQPASVLRNAYWQESLTVIGTSTFQGKDVPNNFAARALFVDGFGRFDVGLGLSWMQNPGPYNGGNINFNLQLAYRFVFLPLTLTYTHMSDAGSKLPNYGRDIVLLGWRFH